MKEILDEMKSAWMHDETLAKAFGYNVNDDFDETFSKVSIVSLLLYVVASVIYIREKMHEKWQEDVDKTALGTRYGTKQWWFRMVKMWQKGDSVKVFEDGSIGYPVEDEIKRIVKSVALRNNGLNLEVLVAKGEDNLEMLSTEEVSELNAYLNEITPLGIVPVAHSYQACELTLGGEIYYDGQQDTDIILGNIETAVKKYLNNIEFGGVVYKNKVIDAIQSVEGVTDALITLQANDNGQVSPIPRTYQAKGGYYQLEMTARMRVEVSER